MTSRKKTITIILLILILASMGLFSFFRKKSEPIKAVTTTEPYKDSSTNLIYNLLFCDNLELYKANTKPPYNYPYDILFSESSNLTDLQKVIDDNSADPRNQILAYK